MKKIPITNSFDNSQPALGYASISDEYSGLIANGNMVFAPGFIVKESHIDKDGVTIYDKVELVEISMIPASRSVRKP